MTFDEIKYMNFDEIAAIIQNDNSEKLREICAEERVRDINMKNNGSQATNGSISGWLY